MTNNISISQFRSIEMGICRESGDAEACVLLPIDVSVRENLVEMLYETYAQLEGEKEEYELTQKYSSKEKLRLDSASAVAAKARDLWAAKNLPIDPRALDHPSDILYYFSIFRYRSGGKVLGVRRATQFKGILRARNRLVRMIDDTLHVLDDQVFRLDLDFDYLVEADQVLIVRPVGFEYTAGVESFAEEAIGLNLDDLGRTLTFIDFEPLAPFVLSHKRAARLVAALRSRSDLEHISKSKLAKVCRDNGVIVRQRAGKLVPEVGHEEGFLQILDRRRYNITLVASTVERYEAQNRRAV